ncbi:osteopetrosis-associated transmembrane protein 1 isoform X4 [Oncorhynchus clarkii lewisi]|uniref:osteopetrosis-associated transmembrane protein 1 isoform X4 n=1 Tax=Oncorhynchus clarkii lewisi TaxID=490388 RepID=UPI0039B96C1C
MFILQVGALLIALTYYANAQTSVVAVNTTIPGSEQSASGLRQLAAAVVPQSSVFHPSLRSQFSLNLLSAFPEDLEMGPGNVSCRDSLLRSDRLMLVFLLYSNLEDIWTASECNRCVSLRHHSLTNDTLYFMETLNQSLSCFEKYQKGNHSELCTECKATYRGLNELYSRMEKNHTLCIDIEDSMNMTRILWSKDFNCSFPRAETVPVIAVSSFMLFLPIIFYLSSFLHSEQKKRKLIHPKRAKSNPSFINIQDKFS